MKKYVVLQADNIREDIYTSDPIDTLKEASKMLSDSYEEIIESSNDHSGIESEAKTLYRYSVLRNCGDFFYGCIKPIEV